MWIAIIVDNGLFVPLAHVPLRHTRMGVPVYFEGLFWLGTMFVYAFRENPWRESMDSIRDQREPSELCEELCEELSELCEHHGDDA